MKNQDVIQSFINGQTKGKTKNLRIEGDKLINYNTVIAERELMPNMEFYYTVNVTKYSMSTTTIQNKLTSLLSEQGKDSKVVKVSNVSIGASSL